MPLFSVNNVVSCEPGHFPASRNSIPQADCRGGRGKSHRVTSSTGAVSFVPGREESPVPGRKQDSMWDSIPGLCSHVLVPVQHVQSDPRIPSSFLCQGLSWQGACPSSSVEKEALQRWEGIPSVPPDGRTQLDIGTWGKSALVLPELSFLPSSLSSHLEAPSQWVPQDSLHFPS